jgi:hypothetical protein
VKRGQIRTLSEAEQWRQSATLRLIVRCLCLDDLNSGCSGGMGNVIAILIDERQTKGGGMLETLPIFQTKQSGCHRLTNSGERNLSQTMINVELRPRSPINEPRSVRRRQDTLHQKGSARYGFW